MANHVAEIQKIRLQHVRSGAWPAASLAHWHEIAAGAQGRLNQGLPINDRERHALDVVAADNERLL